MEKERPERNETLDGRPLYPTIEVKMIGEDGNIFSILGRCTRAARVAHLPEAQIEAFRMELTNKHGYDEALQTVLKWFSIEDHEENVEIDDSFEYQDEDDEDEEDEEDEE